MKNTIIATFPTFRRLPVAFLLALVAMTVAAQDRLIRVDSELGQ